MDLSLENALGTSWLLFNDHGLLQILEELASIIVGTIV
jgi:hypothetical protein